jgi:hypothetical protein
VAARRVHEELQRVERAGDGRSRDRALLLRGVVAHDDVALLERDPKAGQVVLGQLMLVRQSLNVLLLDETALGGLLEQALDRGEIVQVNGVAQLMFLSLMVGCRISAPRGGVLTASRAAPPPRRVIERRCTEVHSQTWVFFYFRTKSHSLLMQGKITARRCGRIPRRG